MSDDRALVAQSIDGDPAAFSALLRQHDDKMRGVVWRMVPSRTEMDDVLQDAYLKAWRAIGKFRGEAAFSTWLYRIVYTTALDHLKVAKRRRAEPLDESQDWSNQDPANAIADATVLRSALAELPADQLAVVTLVDGQGQSYETVADLLGISAGTVGSRLSRARASLRKRLSTDGRNFDGGHS